MYTVRCQVLYRDQRQSGMITVRVPLPEPPAEDVAFEAPVVFGGVDARTWNMEGRDGQTWTAESMALVGTSSKPGMPPAPSDNGKPKAVAGSSSS